MNQLIDGSPDTAGYYSVKLSDNKAPFGTTHMTLYWDMKRWRYHPKDKEIEIERIITWSKQ